MLERIVENTPQNNPRGAKKRFGEPSENAVHAKFAKPPEKLTEP